jgi:hypothetical protein
MTWVQMLEFLIGPHGKPPKKDLDIIITMLGIEPWTFNIDPPQSPIEALI